MRLISTLWETVKWKKALGWYIGLTIFVWLSYDPANGPIVAIILIQIMVTIIAIMLILSVWYEMIANRTIINRPVTGLPILWLFSTVIENIIIFDDDDASGRLLQMNDWCDENCDGKWKYCRHGYFVFRKKTDAMGFKLRWM